MDFDFPSTDAATLPRDSNDVLLIQQNHADWQPIIGFVNQQGNDQSRVRRQRTPSDSCRSVSSISISNITDATRSSIIDS